MDLTPLQVARFMVSIEIYDNETKRLIVSEGCNVGSVAQVENMLIKAALVVTRGERT